MNQYSMSFRPDEKTAPRVVGIINASSDMQMMQKFVLYIFETCGDKPKFSGIYIIELDGRIVLDCQIKAGETWML